MAIAPRSPEELLRDVRSIRDLPPNDLRALAEAAEVRKAARGRTFFTDGQEAEGFWIVRTGEVKLVKSGRDAREQILYLARPGRPILEGVRFDGGKYPASAVAMRAASALLISNDHLRSLGEKRPNLFQILIDLKSHRTERNLQLISDLSLRTVPARIASFIYSLALMRESKGQDARNFMRDLTTETVAGRLGTVREEISRGLAQLEKKGAINVDPDMIEIVDMERLEELAYGKKRP